MSLDSALGSAFGIGETAGGILLTLIMFMMFAILPIIKKMQETTMMVGLMVMVFGVIVSWCPLFVLIVYIFGVAVGLGYKFRDMIHGKLP